ncbi:chorismate-binding protein [Cellulophaga sp. HaHaR_3_176]|uniref:chorismate-binding protein n=1 Tax=Cellulophaga sp. HaHaR_3_176 TaxID=1942464 RepID=UPI001C1F5BC2|nr:chorismate-binding protein [Cellulophaga sp. HaHaR_3_176]QWX85474.1 chorismate-binding protein [Cellulophaga sp. HaHaR_3_176]
MFTDLIQKAENSLETAKPFVLYRKPKEIKVIGVFQNSDALHFIKDYSESGFVFAPFNAEQETILTLIDDRVEAIFESESKSNNQNRIVTANTDKELHINLIKRGIKSIENNEFQKVVLSRKIDVETQKTAVELFKDLLSTYSNAFCYLWYHPKVGTWLGATPEILLQIERKQLKTMSLAGTQKYTGDDTPVWGNKELKEQELVTQYIVEALADEVEGLKISETESVRAGNLLHLRTSVSGKLKNAVIKNVIHALHPTPAVCGLPKNTTKAFILEHENYDRAYYTGFLGELNFKEESLRSNNRKNRENQVYKAIKNTNALYVNLRCMQLKNTAASIYVGGGITKESDPIKEWEETVAKSDTMLKVLSS